METSIGSRDWLVSEVPDNVWQAINDRYEEMSQKTSEKDLEDVLEFIHVSATPKPGEGMGVQFQPQGETRMLYMSTPWLCCHREGK